MAASRIVKAAIGYNQEIRREEELFATLLTRTQINANRSEDDQDNDMV